MMKKNADKLDQITTHKFKVEIACYQNIVV